MSTGFLGLSLESIGSPGTLGQKLREGYERVRRMRRLDEVSTQYYEQGWGAVPEDFFGSADQEILDEAAHEDNSNDFGAQEAADEVWEGALGEALDFVQAELLEAFAEMIAAVGTTSEFPEGHSRVSYHETGFIQLGGVEVLYTGGMSGGDAPTEAFDFMQKVLKSGFFTQIDKGEEE